MKKETCQCKTCIKQNKNARYCRQLQDYCSGNCKNCKGESKCIYYEVAGE